MIQTFNSWAGPGGYIQWDEVDTIGALVKSVPGTSGRHLDQLFSQVRGHDTWVIMEAYPKPTSALLTVQYRWKYQLTHILDESGYAESELFIYEYPLGMASFWSDL